MLWLKDSLVPNVIFELRPNLESLWKSTSDEPIRFGDKAIFRPKKLTWNLSFWDFWSGQKTPWCWGDLAKRLLGDDLALAPRSLLARSYPCNKIRYLYYRGMNCPKDSLVLWGFVKKTPWCWFTPTPRSLLAKSPPKTLKAISRSSRLAPRSHLSKPLQSPLVLYKGGSKLAYSEPKICPAKFKLWYNWNMRHISCITESYNNLNLPGHIFLLKIC